MLPENLNYQFDLSTAKGEDFAPVLDELFRNDKWQELLRKRNHIAKEFITRKPNPAFAKSLTIIEGKLQSILFNTIFEFSKEIKGNRTVQLGDLLDSEEMSPEQIANLRDAMHHVDALTFLNDIMIGQLNDTIACFQKVDDSFTLPELSGLRRSLDTMHSWSKKRRQSETEAEQDLFNDYADSIERYLKGRLNTFLKKYGELKKQQKAERERIAQEKKNKKNHG